jgi:hypothetical protein
MYRYVYCSDSKHMTSNNFFKIPEKGNKNFSQLFNPFLEKLHNMYTCMEEIPTWVVSLSI